MRDKNLIYPSKKARMAVTAVNTTRQEVSCQEVYTPLEFFAAFLGAVTRPNGIFTPEIVGFLRGVPKHFKDACDAAFRIMREVREASIALNSFEHEVKRPYAKNDKVLQSQEYQEACADWNLKHADLKAMHEAKEKAFDKAWQGAVDLFDFIGQMAEIGNTATMLKHKLQPTAANIFHGMLKDIYRPGRDNEYPFADLQIATIIMRYLGSPHLKLPERDKSDYPFFQLMVQDLMNFWGHWSGCPEFYTHVIRALHRTDQLHVLRRALYFDKVIPAFLRYAEEADRELRRKDIKTGEYGEFDPEDPFALIEKHRDYLHVSSYMLFEVLQLILFCYFKPPKKDWWRRAAFNR